MAMVRTARHDRSSGAVRSMLSLSRVVLIWISTPLTANELLNVAPARFKLAAFGSMPYQFRPATGESP
jgi:hypothetical protein